MAWLLLPIPIGITARLRSAYLKAANACAEYAERTREEEARHRVAEERMRIACELHDVVAHHLALANAQAGTVAHLVRTGPGQAEKIAADLADTISSALRELKGTVGLLRQPDDPAAPLEPAPGLAQLPVLGENFRSPGGGRAGLMTIRVLLADDQALLRETFRILIDSCPDMTVVGKAADGSQAVQLARVHAHRC